MKINEEQIDLLNSFQCIRLSEFEDVNKYISVIENRRGNQLIKYLQEYGEDEDRNGLTAFYLVLSNDNLPLAFFSLKCGLLFSPSIIESVENNVVFLQRIIETLEKGRDDTNPESIAIFKSIEEHAAKKNCTVNEMINNLKQQVTIKRTRAILYKTQYHNDEKTEANKPIYRVHMTYPGIELVHFCVNENAKDYWKTLNINHPMGEVLFWWIIVPKLKEVQQIVGCQYVYLFAADSSEDRTLINYYNVSLKFVKPDGIGTSKPRYDFCCEFLLQEINKLDTFRDSFLDNFNIDKDTYVI